MDEYGDDKDFRSIEPIHKRVHDLGIQIMNNIEQIHAQVHSLGHKIMQCVSEKRKEDAVQDLEELQTTVSNLVEILDKLIDKYNV